MSGFPRELAADRYRAISAKALRAGVLPRHGLRTTSQRWELIGQGPARCLNPSERTFIGIADGRHPRERVSSERNPRDVLGEITFALRCRGCKACALAKAQHWAIRCRFEAAAASRVWFITGTVKPMLLHKMKQTARQEHEAWSEYSDETRRTIIARLVGKEVTLYLKRLRKAGHKFRYLFVTELHASGEPHVHALIFEQGEPIGERPLRREWRRHVGLAQATRVENPRYAAGYVAKYVTKATRCRMRASLRFGRTNERKETKDEN